MEFIRSEKEVDKLIEDMVSRTKGRNITQGVTFNKTCPRQMGLLKKALMSSTSFSGLAKELLAIKFSENQQQLHQNTHSSQPIVNTAQTKETGNFF